MPTSTSAFVSRLILCIVSGLALLSACSDSTAPGRAPEPDGGTGGRSPSSGGAPSSGGTPPSADAGNAGSGGAASGGAASGGSQNDGGPAGGGAEGGHTPVSTLVESGAATSSTAPRPAFGAMVAVRKGDRHYVVESRRDAAAGPFNLPWRSRFRLAVYDGVTLAWAFEAPADDLIGDVAVHPSGAVTVSVQRHPEVRLSYDLVRLAPNGDVVATTTLEEPVTTPDKDFAAGDPRPLFRMKSYFPDALTAGWVRLVPDGEGLFVAFLSYVDVPTTSPLVTRFALGLEAMDWNEARYVERWARVVEGPHAAEPAAWAYDEFRWREQAVRPFLTRDRVTGELVVARAFNRLRCEANLGTFAEFTEQDCKTRSANPIENERLPLIVTRFEEDGRRIGSFLIEPDEGAAEQMPFDLVAQDGLFAVAGSVVRTLEGGAKRTYDANGFVDYDGYISIHDSTGARLRGHDFDSGRGDVLAALEWTSDGIMAAGAAGWDRWQGGMSIGKGADPFFVWLSEDASRSASRIVSMTEGSRHFHLHDVAVENDSVMGYGLSDAPMTHSADGNKNAERTYGPLRLTLTPPPPHDDAGDGS